MISGAHVVIYTKDAEADRAFLRDKLGFRWVDGGGGWLIFALPPAEVACHPSESNGQHELYFLCDDLTQEVAALEAKGVHCSKIHEHVWGWVTRISLPGGGTIGLYQAKHPTAHTLAIAP